GQRPQPWYLDSWSPLCSKYTGEHRNRREQNERGVPMRLSLAQKKGFATAILLSSDSWKYKGVLLLFSGRFCVTSARHHSCPLAFVSESWYQVSMVAPMTSLPGKEGRWSCQSTPHTCTGRSCSCQSHRTTSQAKNT